MPPPPKKQHLSYRQLRAIVALMQCASVREAAKRAGVNAKTLKRWRRDPRFAALYRKKSEAMFAFCLAEMQGVINQAFAVLVRQMNSETNKPSDVIKAASAIINFAFKANELTELRNALARYEKLNELINRRETHGMYGIADEVDNA